MSSEQELPSMQHRAPIVTTPAATRTSHCTKSGSKHKPITKKQNLKKLSHQLSSGLRHKAIELGWPLTPDGYVPVQDILSHSMFQNYTLRDIIEVVQTNDKQRFTLQDRPLSNYYKCHTNAAESPAATDCISDGGNSIAGPLVVDNPNGISGTIETSMILCIRANQGHSMPLVDSDLLLQRLASDDLLLNYPIMVHGTYFTAWAKILSSGGLSKMERNHIHFATGIPQRLQPNDERSTGSNNPVVISGMRRTCEVYVYIDIRKCVTDQIPIYKSDNGVLLTDGIDNSGMLPLRYVSHVTNAVGDILWKE